MRISHSSLPWLVLVLAIAGCGDSDNTNGPDAADASDGGDADAGINAEADAGNGADADAGLETDADADDPTAPIVVNSLQDMENPPAKTVTLRSALAMASSGQPIVFDASLDGQTIELTIIAEEHSVLLGEVMGMKEEPSGPVSYLEGYFERDYGKSALYARKDVVIDASLLPSGITLSWAGGEEDQARVLAVFGDLTMTNVTVTNGNSVAGDISATNEDQPWTLARGGGVAVWGVARLKNCRLIHNQCLGDFDSSRDRGAYGGGVYANIVEMSDCIVAGNSVVGGGAAGGGVFSLGGALTDLDESFVKRSSITGNHISGLFAYGAGVYSDGGGIGNSKTLKLTNATIARNLADAPPGLPGFLLGMGYWRGGGAYMSNGKLLLHSCTVVENQVHGVPRTDALGKSNLAGGIAATIGNAHAVDYMLITHSIIAGNTVHETGGAGYAHDIFTGSLFQYRSCGYNRIGVIDFGQILVPVSEPGYRSLCRKHHPKQGDRVGIALADVLDLTNGVTLSDSILSAGVDASNPVVLHYLPAGTALDQVPESLYTVEEIFGEYEVAEGGTDNFLAIVLDRIEAHYELAGFAATFTADFESFLQTVDVDEDTDGFQPYTDPEGAPILTLADTHWFGPAETWNKELANYPYIEFWHRLDAALEAENIPGMGPELLGDDAWQALFSSGALTENQDITLSMASSLNGCAIQQTDQLGVARAQHATGDIGAIEVP